MNEEQVQPSGGRFSRSWQLTKSSWHAFKLDKELAAFPVLTALAAIAVLLISIPLAIGVFHVTGLGPHDGNAIAVDTHSKSWWLYAIPVYLVLGIVVNFFSGALIASALKRFGGGDPTVSYGIGVARRRFGSIAIFSLLSTTVVLALQWIGDRLPFVGWLLTRILNAAWQFATIFAIPVIVTSPEPVSPNQAVLRSAKIIRQVWAESVIASFSLGLITAFGIIGFFALWGVVAGVGASLSLPIALGVFWWIFGMFGFIALIVVSSTLSSILKAAIYYYAVTGEAPAQFDRRLLQASFTAKKARKVFAR